MKKYKALLISLLIYGCDIINNRYDNGTLANAKQCREGQGQYLNCTNIYRKEKEILASRAEKNKTPEQREQEKIDQHKREVILKKEEFFKICTTSLEPISEKDVKYTLTQSPEGKSYNVYLDIDTHTIEKIYKERKQSIEKTKSLLEQNKDSNIFQEVEGFEIPENCNTEEKYLQFLHNLISENDRQFATVNQKAEKIATEKLNFIQTEYRKIYDQAFGNVDNRSTPSSINSVTRNDGMSIAQNTLFAGSRYKGWEYYFIIILTQKQNVNLKFNSNNELIDELKFNTEDYYTFVEKIDINKIIVKATDRQGNWDKFILQPTKNQKFQRGQNLNEYAFKVVGTTKYQNDDWVVVEAIK